jgi:thiamine-monophosphate kinase
VTAPPHLGEFGRIARFFAPLAAEGALGLVDDVALIDGPAGEQYALTTDTIIEGVDYFPDDPPALVAKKLLRVNLSDLAAKGARPFGYLLTTALPATCGEAWLEAFSAGLAADQEEYGLALLGGDSSATPGPTTLSVAALGLVAKGKAILRSGARAGDLIYVSGTIGDAALGLAILKREVEAATKKDRDFLVDRYHLPLPRLALGQKLVGLANAMIDVSDGLVADLKHVCDASKLAATLRAAAVPHSEAAHKVLKKIDNSLSRTLGGGDDYELLFTSPPELAAKVEAAIAAAGVPATVIGEMGPGEGVKIVDAQGKPIKLDVAGYSHF